MNPSTAGLWNNPPPPGLEDEQEHLSKYDSEKPVNNKSPPTSTVDHEKKHKDRHGHRRRSRSRSRDRSRRHRSRSKRRHRKSRSRSRGHHRHRSGSRSISHDRSKHRSHKDRRRRRSHSKSRRSRSRSRKHHRSSKKSYSRSPVSIKNERSDNEDNREDEETEENKNTFKNDGSFLELYKKQLEEQQKAEAAKLEAQANDVKRAPMFGKRRGGRVLKTGIVAKNKQGDDGDGVEPQDPWSIYLKEVKRYKEACCDDDSKTRPLVK